MFCSLLSVHTIRCSFDVRSLRNICSAFSSPPHPLQNNMAVRGPDSDTARASMRSLLRHHTRDGLHPGHREMAIGRGSFSLMGRDADEDVNHGASGALPESEGQGRHKGALVRSVRDI
ncbi:hypothetical protein GN956_G22347 [Arapaima gigas]